MIEPTPQDGAVEDGCIREIDGQRRIYYDGYWIKVYDPPADSLEAKKRLIAALTRRLFNHVEHGINIPGNRLEEARAAFENEFLPERRRVKGAMLAGALFNRATDIFTKLVELQSMGVKIECDNALMRECGMCLRESLELGRLVLHRSGEEGIDELWGEPFRAFSIPVDAFYESRYIKIAQTMHDIDAIRSVMLKTLGHPALFPLLRERLDLYCNSAKRKCETLRTDPAIFDVWTDFVVACEHLATLEATWPVLCSPEFKHRIQEAMRLLSQGRELIADITRARTPMPKSTREFARRCEHFSLSFQPLLCQLPSPPPQA
jgi:hypothetical protein